MNTCPNCGTTFGSDAFVCPRCGWIPGSRVWPIIVDPHADYVAQKRRKILLACLGVVAFTLGIILLVVHASLTVLGVTLGVFVVLDIVLRSGILSSLFVTGVIVAFLGAIAWCFAGGWHYNQ
jgi:hypothetical protein